MNLSNYRPSKDKISTYLPLGSFLIIISFLDILINTFFNLNITSFLSQKISYFFPLAIGFIGFYLIKI